jgi:hypothetical protein
MTIEIIEGKEVWLDRNPKDGNYLSKEGNNFYKEQEEDNYFIFTENEWTSNKEIIHWMLDDNKSKFTYINFDVRFATLEEANQFYERNHIKGRINDSFINVCLTSTLSSSSIYAMVSFNQKKIMKDYVNLEISRFCCRREIIILGALSKMIQHFPFKRDYGGVFFNIVPYDKYAIGEAFVSDFNHLFSTSQRRVGVKGFHHSFHTFYKSFNKGDF